MSKVILVARRELLNIYLNLLFLKITEINSSAVNLTIFHRYDKSYFLNERKKNEIFNFQT